MNARSVVVPRVYLITDRHATGGRDLLQTVEEALRPLKHEMWGKHPPHVALQLREKDLEGGALFALAEKLRILTADAGVGLWINGRCDVAVATEADGVHLGWLSPTIAHVKSMFPELGVAVSSHSVSELGHAEDAGADFAVLGPIFDTPSKIGIIPALGVSVLLQCADLSMPVLALGGVDMTRVDSCMGHGAYGVSVIRGVFASIDPEAALQELVSKMAKIV